MSFRQFPATDANGETRIILEFVSDQSDGAEKRYELDSGEPLERDGRQYHTRDGALTFNT